MQAHRQIGRLDLAHLQVLLHQTGGGQVGQFEDVLVLQPQGDVVPGEDAVLLPGSGLGHRAHQRDDPAVHVQGLALKIVHVLHGIAVLFGAHGLPALRSSGVAHGGNDQAGQGDQGEHP